jgi:hypothetical protein
MMFKSSQRFSFRYSYLLYHSKKGLLRIFSVGSGPFGAAKEPLKW